MQYYAMGTALVSRDELVEKAAIGDIAKLADAVAKKRDHTLTLTTGIATPKNLLMAAAPPQRAPFIPIATGTPLTIELRHVYTGEQPHASFFQKTKDMIVTSAMKEFLVYKSAPRAVNMLERSEIPDHLLLTESDGPFVKVANSPVEPAGMNNFIGALASLRGTLAPKLERAVVRNFGRAVGLGQA
jgi:TatD related DNase